MRAATGPYARSAFSTGWPQPSAEQPGSPSGTSMPEPAVIESPKNSSLCAGPRGRRQDHPAISNAAEVADADVRLGALDDRDLVLAVGQVGRDRVLEYIATSSLVWIFDTTTPSMTAS